METGQPFDPIGQPAYVTNEFSETQIEFNEFNGRLCVSEYKVEQDRGGTQCAPLASTRVHIYLNIYVPSQTQTLLFILKLGVAMWLSHSTSKYISERF